LLVEVVRRRAINRKIEATVHLIGYALLLGLMVFFTFRDVGRIITG
jgi:membrane-associated protease RseP (regulator of RpoE activity)